MIIALRSKPPSPVAPAELLLTLVPETSTSTTKAFTSSSNNSEVKSDKVDSKPHSISYLHRTVKDYIEQQKVWDSLVLKTQPSSFDPHTALLTAYVMELKTASVDSPAMTINEGALEILCRCSRLDPSGSTADIELVNEMDRVLRLRYTEDSSKLLPGQWLGTQRSPENNRRRQWDEDLLTMAMKQDMMHWYVHAKLASKDERSVGREGLPLLGFALCLDSWCHEGKAQLPSYHMVQLVLNHGGSPNGLYQAHTIWQYVIQYVHILNDMEAKEPNFPGWMQIFTLMLEHGADPYARCIREDCCTREDRCIISPSGSGAYTSCFEDRPCNHSWAHCVRLKKDGEMGYELASIRDHTQYKIKPWPGEGYSIDSGDPDERHEKHHSVTAVVNDVFRRRGVPGVDSLIKLLERTKNAIGMRGGKRKRKNRAMKSVKRPNWVA
jgi:hypothetical protein